MKEEDEKQVEAVAVVVETGVPRPRSSQLNSWSGLLKTEKEKATAHARGSSPHEKGGPHSDRHWEEEEFRRLIVEVDYEVEKFLMDRVAVVPQNAAERRAREAMAMAGALAVASRIVRERAASGGHRRRRRASSPLGHMPYTPQRAHRGLRARGPGLGRGRRGHALSPEADLVAAPDMAPEAALVAGPKLDPEPEWVTIPDLDPAPDSLPA